MAIGPAGTGKTYVSVAEVVRLYEESDYRQIILIRPNVSTGPTLGLFPGEANEKLMNWMTPLVSLLKEHFGANALRQMMNSGAVLLQPVETIRGASFENALIIVDEAQNLSRHELTSVITRIGQNSKMILTGDPDQSDVADSGLLWFKNLAERHRLDVGIAAFGVEDIVRSDFVGSFLKALYHDNRRKGVSPN